MRRIKQKNKIFTLTEVIIITLISNVLIFVTIGIILYNNYEKNSGISFNNLVEDKALKDFLEVYNSITNDYYEDIDKNELLNKAIDSMMEYLGDNYTSFVDKNDTSAINEIINGEYIGIGVELSTDNIIRKVYNDSPAQKAGIEVDDQIIKIDNLDVTSENHEQIISYIKSKNKEKITLVVLRDNKEKQFVLAPQSVIKPIVNSAVLENSGKKIGYIAFRSFSNNLPNQFEQNLLNLEHENITGLIVDLRDNTGGVLNTVKPLANLFLKKNKIIYILENRLKNIKYKDDTDEYRTYPIVVLINNNTASAAEILTAALKDSYNAIIVGQKSYGKGKVQQIMNLSNGTAVKYTTAKWYTPKNKYIDGVGLSPDYLVKNEYTAETKVYVDNQLNKALEILG